MRVGDYILQPNTYCKNINCSKGKDGKRNYYYSCKFCARQENWKSVACCIECFEKFVEQIKEKRSEHDKTQLFPERTDISKAQYDKLMKTPIEQVKDESVKELIDSGYDSDLNEIGFTQTIEKINSEIREHELLKTNEILSEQTEANTSETSTNKLLEKNRRTRRIKYN